VTPAEPLGTLGALVQIIAQALADHPDQVQVREVEGEQVTIVELHVAKADLGKIIGKQGRTANAMRLLLGAVANKQGKRITLEILE
jgi:uncharacterized protein